MKKAAAHGGPLPAGRDPAVSDAAELRGDIGAGALSGGRAAPVPAALRRGEVNRRRKDQALLLNAIRILDRFIPEKRGLLTPLPQVGMEELLDEKALEEDFQVARRLQELDEELRDLASRASRELAELDALQPWQWLEMPLEYTGTPGCSVTLGTMPGRLELEDLKKTLAGAVEEAELICVSQEGESSFLLLFASRDRTEDALGGPASPWAFPR